jgi:prephenate dehydrogenase
LAGQKIMVYPVRCNDTLFETFLRFITGLELHIIETTPQAHDQAMAYIQGLSHYVGRIMQALAITDYALSTQAYRDLLDMKNVQGNDSDDLFRSIVHNNGYTEQVLADFKEAMRHVDDMFHL